MKSQKIRENKIIQWNIGGLTADKRNELKFLYKNTTLSLSAYKKPFLQTSHIQFFPVSKPSSEIIKPQRNLREADL